MKNKNNRVVTTKAWMERARQAIENEDRLYIGLSAFVHGVEGILSDGQMQQMDRLITELSEAVDKAK